jgi:hypothetical protein
MDLEERHRRLDRARLATQAEIMVGLMAVILTAYFSIMASPWGSDPMFFVPFLFQLLVLAAPVVSLVAWVWMLRLSRPQPEAGEPSWRYRAFPERR